MTVISGFFKQSVILALFLCLVLPLASRADETFAIDDYAIVTSDGVKHHFLVEIASTEAQRSQGLMYRYQMAPTNGMLFEFGRTRYVRMWMKNTYIPLDILFIDRNGRIASIAENTEPLSERIIESKVDVDFALELNAGTAKALNIKVGDQTFRGANAKESEPLK